MCVVESFLSELYSNTLEAEDLGFESFMSTAFEGVDVKGIKDKVVNFFKDLIEKIRQFAAKVANFVQNKIVMMQKRRADALAAKAKAKAGNSTIKIPSSLKAQMEFMMKYISTDVAALNDGLVNFAKALKTEIETNEDFPSDKLWTMYGSINAKLEDWKEHLEKLPEFKENDSEVDIRLGDIDQMLSAFISALMSMKSSRASLDALIPSLSKLQSDVVSNIKDGDSYDDEELRNVMSKLGAMLKFITQVLTFSGTVINTCSDVAIKVQSRVLDSLDADMAAAK